MTIFDPPGLRAPSPQETKRVATALAEMGCDIITGGGPGLMQAARSAAAAPIGLVQSALRRVTLRAGRQLFRRPKV